MQAQGQGEQPARRTSTAEQANDLRAAVLGFNDGLVGTSAWSWASRARPCPTGP
ncbi:MAG: hypothetical protein ACREH6_14320 [Geminicoccaceae bacterium]